jgi:hypothetical protein
MPKHHTLACVLFASTMLTTAGAAISAEVTAERLIHADKEPQNWLMNHRTYDAQRYSPLDRINKANAKDLKLAYAVALGGTWANANLESTPLAEDGYLYVVDQWGVLYKIDGRSGDLGRILRAHQRPDAVGEALPGHDQLDQRHRPENRSAGRLRPEQGHPGLFGLAESDPDRRHEEALSVA